MSNMVQSVAIFVFLASGFIAANCYRGRYRDDYYGSNDLWWSPPEPYRPYWLPEVGCPPEIYYFNRLECYNNGRYFKSPNNQHRPDKGTYRRERMQSRRMQAKVELEKFRTHTGYKPGVTGNNAILL
ncbi:uncharacterized protein LOC132197901 [Neocloeon triangulifer]|uniref:uncharacterized protein LOC132197901 n=1 Tax=Neocloeon triangulifer TaxID=2078957 RepID=UPI00286FA1E2|nr:uncharacterized protein LOC132197901 [Neocloeon triangulifer]